MGCVRCFRPATVSSLRLMWVTSTWCRVERGRVDGVVVVLRGDFDLAGVEVLDGMVGAVVAELELVGLAAKRQAEDLVAEADAEERRLAGEVADVLLRVVEGLGIAGAVRKEDAVGVHGEDFCRRCLAGTTVTRQFSRVSMRRMLDLMPKS